MYRRDAGRTRYCTKEDWHSVPDLRRAVRASSTLPIVMPPTTVGGQVCYDGGLGEDHGMLISQARRDGYERFFVVRTRAKGYRKPLHSSALVKGLFWRRPAMRAALDKWGGEYNQVCDTLERMESQGSALVVYADTVTAENSTTDYECPGRISVWAPSRPPANLTGGFASSVCRFRLKSRCAMA